MAATTRQIIASALRKINVIEAGETPSPEYTDIALMTFDQMIDSWSNERLMVYSINPYVFPLIGGQKDYLLGPGNSVVTLTITTPGASYVNGSYTNVPLLGGTGTDAIASITVAGGSVTLIQIPTSYQAGGYGYKVGDVLTVSNTNLGGFGAGATFTVVSINPGDWNLIRPLRIEQATIIWNDPLSIQAVDISMAELNDAQYSSIAVKNTPSTFPLYFYDNGNFPLKTISVFPVPNTGSSVRLWLRQPLVNFQDLDQFVQYPPGYERAFTYCLALELAPEFGKTPSPEVLGIAAKSKADLASFNAEPQYMTGDGALSGDRKPWNWIFSPDMLPIAR